MANKVLGDYQDRVDEILKDEADRLSVKAQEAAIAEAITEHSRHRPVIKKSDIAGNGTAYDIPLGAEGGLLLWQEGFSAVRDVEYPAGERKPVYLERDEWTEYQTPTGRVLRLLDTTPQTGKSTRITYTIMHSVTQAAGTIPDGDFDAVCNLAASFGCHKLALIFAQSSDSTIAADSVDHRSKSSDYAQRSKELRALYFAHMGIKDERGAPPASVTADWDQQMGHGDDYLTHPKEWR